MWVLTTFGFFSVVQKRDTKHLTVWARVRSDLDRLRARDPDLREQPARNPRREARHLAGAVGDPGSRGREDLDRRRRPGDLEAGLRDAPKKDAGFSPLTLAWVLRGFDLGPPARGLGWAESEERELSAFRDWLVERLTAGAAPG